MKITETQAAEWLRANDNFIVITHRRPDGDTLASAAALVSGLRKSGKTAYVLKNEEATDKYLPFVEAYFASEGYEPSSVVTVDTASEEMFPANAAVYKDKTDLALDHHGSNSGYAKNICLRAEHAACGELVYDILMELNGAIDEKEAELLYVAVATDTGCFAYGNTNANTLRCAAFLVEAGAKNGALNKMLFRTQKKSRLMLESMMINGIEYYHDDKTAIAYVTGEMIKECGVTESELDDIASIPGKVEGVKVGVTIKELSDGTSKISVRTMPEVNANDICARFGGGGHNMAAGCTIAESPKKAGELIAAVIGEIMKDGQSV